jgi:hypothetical protein
MVSPKTLAAMVSNQVNDLNCSTPLKLVIPVLLVWSFDDFEQVHLHEAIDCRFSQDKPNLYATKVSFEYLAQEY